MLLKCCTQYASKFGKLSSSHRTGKGEFSFQSQRKAMPTNVKTTIKLHSFHMLVRLYSKSFNLGFSSMWSENFQMYELGLEKAEEPEIKLSTFVGLWRKQESSRKTSTSVSLITLKPLTAFAAVAWSFLTLCDAMDCSPPGSSVHEILQARIMEWIAISLLQGIFPTQGLNLDLLHCRQILYHLNQKIADIMDSFCTKALESKIF